MNYKQQKPPEVTKCPQCRSDGCGPLRCRFSMIEHGDFKRMRRRVKSAGTGGSLKIDRFKRAEYQAIADSLGFSSSFEPHPTHLVMHVNKD